MANTIFWGENLGVQPALNLSLIPELRELTLSYLCQSLSSAQVLLDRLVGGLDLEKTREEKEHQKDNRETKKETKKFGS